VDRWQVCTTTVRPSARSSVCSGNATDGIVYSVPNRFFAFDSDFLQPALLPPNTPMFRDVNVIGFSQELRPGK